MRHATVQLSKVVASFVWAVCALPRFAPAYMIWSIFYFRNGFLLEFQPNSHVYLLRFREAVFENRLACALGNRLHFCGR